MKGKVYLVGAGPGDEGLITVKGLRAVKEADVILYDRLANDNLLNKTNEEVELFYVGKKADNHYRTQSEINQLLIDKAKEGKIVTRLKGGDPFVFGRGGEEAKQLAEAGIDFEIIPGITSPIGASAYAGIPVTHRGFSSSLAVVTGHQAADKEESSINWKELSSGVETLVVLMGVGNLPQIVDRLLAAGRSPETPVALVRWGTRTSQETITGKLDNIAEKVTEADFKPPAVIVVGEVVNLREELSWFETKALFGKRIVVTRPKKQAVSFCRRLIDEGAEVIKAPAIEIEPPESYDPLDDKLQQIDSYDWIIFTSVNGVKYTLERLFSLGKDVRSLAGVKLGTIGSKTAARLGEYGLKVDYVPNEYISEAIIGDFKEQDISGQKFLLPRADIARAKLKNGLEELGAEVDNVTAYRTVKGGNNQHLTERLQAEEVDLITFTSSSTVRNLIKGLGEDYHELLTGVDLACIGPITASTARDYNLAVEIIAEEHTIEGLTAAIKEYYNF